MKKILLLTFVMLLATLGYAQLNNSWIDYSKTYYKFNLANDTLCRITKQALATIGLDNTPAQNFQLWRNGKEVRLYTSVATGTLGASDYIEFWGEMNDGKPDKNLYKDPVHQLSDRYSLETDTAVYFLTVNPAGNNLRYTTAGNPVVGTSLTPDAYFMRRIEKNFRNILNRGYAAVIGEYVYSSSYDIGEGWTSNEIFPCCGLAVQIDNLNKYAAGPPNSVTFTIGASGNALNSRDLLVSFFNTNVLTAGMPFFEDHIDTVRNLPLSDLPSNSGLLISVNANGADANDRIVVSCLSVTYPATFNFNNEKNFYFELAANPAGNYLVINNFNNNGIAPMLYDITDGQRYAGNIDVAGQVRFVLPPSSLAVRKFKLVSQDASNVNTIAGGFKSKTFTNFANSSTQGNYLIISNSVLFNNGSGVNNVDLYRQYRASTVGGGFNAKIYDIDELTDQFGFGIKKHPAAVRDFIRYATQSFTTNPKYVFIIGRGMSYDDYTKLQSDPIANQLDLVQTFGWPASDILLACEPSTNVPLIPIGRLGAINGNEIGVYLSKVKEYEQAQQSTIQTIDAKGYMKDFLHTVGGGDSLENAEFTTYVDGYKKIVQDTLYGGHVETFAKTSSSAIEQQQSTRITQMFHEGLGYVKYFGHSSSNELAINLNYPETYDNAGKYPIMHVSGCTVGNFFLYTPARLTNYTGQSLSEKYIFLDKKGSVGFLGSTHFGIAPFLNFYNTDLYDNFSKDQYGGTIGEQIKQTIASLGSNPANLDFYTRMHLEEVNFHGDPALKINSFAKPDYIIEDPMVKFTPNIISVADNNYKVDIQMRNIGKAIGDSISVTIQHKLPDNSIITLYKQKIPSIKYSDSLSLTVAINPITDKGLNKIIVTLDDANAVDELSEMNNSISKDFYIFEDEIRPVAPYNYSIVNQQNITFYASTANPLSTMRQYVMELDTTELFNSAFKKTYNASGTGGVIQFTPTNVTFTDSTVYYWRTATVPSGTASYIWNDFSFVYLPNSTAGFNQSHYYQFQKNTYNNIKLDNDRTFRFTTKLVDFNVRTGIYPYAAETYDYSLRNDGIVEQAGFYGPPVNDIGVLRFYVIDTVTNKAWVDIIDPSNPASGLYGSVPPIPINTTVLPGFFQFKITNITERNTVMNFLNNIVTNGLYVVMTNSPLSSQGSFPVDWKADETQNGAGISLYSTLKASGFSYIDSLKTFLPFVYVYKKGTPGAVVQTFGLTQDEKLDVNFNTYGNNLSGNIISDKFGPAKEWNSLHWRGKAQETPTSDSFAVQVYGIDNTGNANFLATINPAVDTSLSWVDAKVYPYISLKMLNADSTKATPYQLRYWRINATYLPEGAVAPNILFSMKDTVDQGEKIDFKLAFKNISPTAFDSLMKINFVITDKSSVQHVISLPKGKKLISGDTLVVSYQIDTRNLPGSNTIFVDVNPNGDQPEQIHFNNILYKDFYVKGDTYNPLLDVTFDGVHILNKDIVSAKPHILIDLKDESKFLSLSDTSYIKVQVRYPDGALHAYSFGDSMIFTPANLATGNNTATIEFKPTFGQDGEYELIVSGRDVVGNTAGALNYHVMFNVISKPMISNLLNYPNPFTTSTAFVFTVTGSEVPQNIRIQVLTITGKIVREITKYELGPIHIGNNITDFKWDGTDMYGQKLANGVYLYRVLTNLNGKSLDKYTGHSGALDSNGQQVTVTEGVAGTDKYFNKGYGKMVLIR